MFKFYFLRYSVFIILFFYTPFLCWSTGKLDIKELYTQDSTKVSVEVDCAYIDSVICIAENYLGMPHCMGGNGKTCIDCSGFMTQVFSHWGVELPHDANSMAQYGVYVESLKHLQSGDLLFFSKTYKTTKFITHVAIYLGEGNFIHASSSNGVEINNIFTSEYWKNKFVFAKRIFTI